MLCSDSVLWSRGQLKKLETGWNKGGVHPSTITGIDIMGHSLTRRRSPALCLAKPSTDNTTLVPFYEMANSPTWTSANDWNIVVMDIDVRWFVYLTSPANWRIIWYENVSLVKIVNLVLHTLHKLSLIQSLFFFFFFLTGNSVYSNRLLDAHFCYVDNP